MTEQDSFKVSMKLCRIYPGEQQQRQRDLYFRARGQPRKRRDSP